MAFIAEQIRIRGLVQGVGFRPHVWRIAQQSQLSGEVCNDGAGVQIRVWAADSAQIDQFCAVLCQQCPPLARIDAIERSPLTCAPPTLGFRIIASQTTQVQTGIVADAATCAACRAEIFDPNNRRYRYPFTNCTNCGPRLSIINAIPYDRANTSMAQFTMCPLCAAEYANPNDRRFHAQPNACPVCGPQVWLETAHGERIDPHTQQGAADAIAAASVLLHSGAVLAIKGIGGVHLVCDASNAAAVNRLRDAKARDAKPLALMAPDIDCVRRYAHCSDQDAALLASPAAPIVLLAQRHTAPPLAAAIAPGQDHLGFMLPYSPLHHLLLDSWQRPLVMTSGNLSDEPQVISNHQARRQLAPWVDALLLHDREIINRVDDGLVRSITGSVQTLRRGRGDAPYSLRLKALEGIPIPSVLALGGELKNTIALLAGNEVILSQHLGDLSTAAARLAFEQALALYPQLFECQPQVLAVDAHPDYRSAQLGRDWAARAGVPVIAVPHHWAHLVSVLAEHQWPLDAGAVLGWALDGIGYGDGGELWGGELLRFDYRHCQRLAALRSVPLLGGDRAAREPWRNLVAHLMTTLGWEQVSVQWGALPAIQALHHHPLALCQQMIRQGINAPPSSSCGRLFDAVAAALGICREGVSYEGQAAVELETLARPWCEQAGVGYSFGEMTDAAGVIRLDPALLWQQLLDALAQGVEPGLIAARFHLGLADALIALAVQIAHREQINTLALSGGVMQNRLLLARMIQQAQAAEMQVLIPRLMPSHDGGLALGQALIAAIKIWSKFDADC